MSKRTINALVSARLRLRLLQEEDLPLTLAWRNKDYIRKWFFYSNIITWDQHKHWCAEYFQRDTDFIFIIEETQTLHRPVGQIALYHIDWEQKHAEYGRLMIGDLEAAGKGLAKAATILLVDYAFSTLGIKKIELEVFTLNTSAIALYRACGFYEVSEHEGIKKMVIQATRSEHSKRG